ncbi:hypothetical protein EV182_002044 [Spiromyces aspiralis]|uniref:Uncharacterized protein n=1 Tax=Spiromyces aspiralis TaxID=68401 RepID=A0ACC1HEP2_9FUNG|nr:hypothetical protein EV182_002044 [Spiromyces aspiralis]
MPADPTRSEPAGNVDSGLEQGAHKVVDKSTPKYRAGRQDSNHTSLQHLLLQPSKIPKFLNTSVGIAAGPSTAQQPYIPSVDQGHQFPLGSSGPQSEIYGDPVDGHPCSEDFVGDMGDPDDAKLGPGYPPHLDVMDLWERQLSSDIVILRQHFCGLTQGISTQLHSLITSNKEQRAYCQSLKQRISRLQYDGDIGKLKAQEREQTINELKRELERAELQEVRGQRQKAEKESDEYRQKMSAIQKGKRRQLEYRVGELGKRGLEQKSELEEIKLALRAEKDKNSRLREQLDAEAAKWNKRVAELEAALEREVDQRVRLDSARSLLSDQLTLARATIERLADELASRLSPEQLQEIAGIGSTIRGEHRTPSMLCGALLPQQALRHTLSISATEKFRGLEGDTSPKRAANSDHREGTSTSAAARSPDNEPASKACESRERELDSVGMLNGGGAVSLCATSPSPSADLEAQQQGHHLFDAAKTHPASGSGKRKSGGSESEEPLAVRDGGEEEQTALLNEGKSDGTASGKSTPKRSNKLARRSDRSRNRHQGQLRARVINAEIQLSSSDFQKP